MTSEQAQPKHKAYRITQPWIHYHYWLSDEESRQAGYGMCEVVCHLCACSLVVTIDFIEEPPDDGDVQIVRLIDEWSEKHRHGIVAETTLKYINRLFSSICPPERAVKETVDLRTSKESVN